VARADTATLDWVKNLGNDQLGPFSGVQGAKIRVYGRSLWTNQAPKQFTVWTKSFWARLGRMLRAKGPSAHMLVLEAPRGNISISEGFVAAPPDLPGEAQYYFEDGEGNRSNPMAVTTTKVAIVLKGVNMHGTFATAGPHGLEIKLPISVRHETQIIHELGAIVDPDVRVQLLYPWAGESDEHDLARAVLEWVESEGLTRALLSSVAGAGPAEPIDPRPVLQALVDGFLGEENAGWEISLASGDPLPEREDWRERQLGVEPGRPRELVVNVVPPPGGGRTCYALRAVDSDGEVVTGSVVELEADEDGVWVREGVPE
jgi:hypothetical protein